jgi:hypothetical protein
MPSIGLVPANEEGTRRNQGFPVLNDWLGYAVKNGRWLKERLG